MSLRRKVLLVFLLVNVASVAVLVLYVRREAERKLEAEETARGVATFKVDLQSEMLNLGIGQLERVLRAGLSESDLLLRIRDLPLFRTPLFQRNVSKAVIVKNEGPGRAPSYFNLPRQFIFDEGALDKKEAMELVERSLKTKSVQSVARRIAGPLLLGEKEWGGFYLALSDRTEALERSNVPLRDFFLILLPGVVFLFWFTWSLLSRGILDPLDNLATVAKAVSAGNYSQRLKAPERADEIGRVVLAVNRMLELVEDYRDRMEAKVDAKTQEIERKNRELALGQRLAATGTLAAGIAHEINNPLGGMLNAVQRLKRSDLKPEQRERYISLLEECIDRIGSIVKRVLEVSPRITVAGPVDLAEVIRRATELVRHRATRKSVEIELGLDAKVPPVLGESNELSQVILNLLINAIDASRTGGLVKVALHREDGIARVDIEDNGVGMTPEVAEQAFDLFFTTKDAGEGTGLGLAMVHSLVEGFGGTIHFVTHPGQGTKFSVRLPLHREEASS